MDVSTKHKIGYMIFHAQLPIIFSRTGNSRNIGIGGPIGKVNEVYLKSVLNTEKDRSNL